MRRLLSVKLTFLLIGIFLIGAENISAQSLDETLDNLSQTAASAYVAPVISAFGSNLNSGWVNGVPSGLIGFNLQIKVVGVGSFFSDDDKTFSTMGNFNFTASQADQILINESNLTPGSAEYNAVKNEILNRTWNLRMSGPTIVGSENETFRVVFPGESINGEQVGEYILEIPEVKGFLDELPALPQVAAQVTVGTVLGTNVSLRWFPDIEIQDLGKFSFFGFGIIHNPSAWLKVPLPLDIGFGYFYQKMKVGDIFESTAAQYGIYASKTFGMGISITPYAGLTLETSESEVNYSYTFDTPAGQQTADINMTLEGENSFGTTVGVALKLAVINLFVDYKMAKTSTVSGGLWFGF